nr:hypothetical protein CFP56_46097 [Quercus suber]
MTCSRVSQLVDALLLMKMEAGKTLSSYANQYWELYNKIGGGNKKIVVSTFRMGLLEDSELRDLLTRRPLEDMRQLMRRIEEDKLLEDDRLQSKGKNRSTINVRLITISMPRLALAASGSATWVGDFKLFNRHVDFTALGHTFS